MGKLDLIYLLVCLSLAVSVVSLTVTKAVVFQSFRTWVETKSEFFGELFSCFFCFSFYVALLVDSFVHLRLLDFTGKLVILDYIVSYMCIVGFAAIFSGLIYRLSGGGNDSDEE